jgi:archaellum biogenesis ATPase FlaH
MDKTDKQCLADLRVTDPRDDKNRIEQTKGGLLCDSFRWILDNAEFQQWRDNKESRLLWIKGDAGKGKTMLLIGIIDELSQQVARSLQSSNLEMLSYFLCQGTSVSLNNATAILRGMIYILSTQHPFLISHIRKKYDYAGQNLFDDVNAFYSLSQILRQMIHDSRLTTTFLVIDALDECETGLPELLNLINLITSEQASRVKWIVSSRNRDDIEQKLGVHNSHTRLSLELNAEQISNAVDVYINYKVSHLVSIQHENAAQAQVREEMSKKSNGTFLWVALVFEALRRDLFRVLNTFPKGLTPLYDRMIMQVQHLEYDYPKLCFSTLSAAAVVYRPLHMLEIRILAGLQEEFSDFRI